MASVKSRSQPARQARTNPVRRTAQPSASNNGRSGPNSGVPPSPAIVTDSYPAINAFADALRALPVEIVRNFTLLKEVDAKAFLPEQQLREYIARARELPPPQNTIQYDPAFDFLQRQEELIRIRDEALRLGENPPPDCDYIVENVHEAAQAYPETRRSRLQQVRMTVADLLPTMDEKIHVISTTCETLAKHVARMEDAFQGISNEIPEIHRIGNLDHWGFKPMPPRGTLAARAAAEKAAAAAAAAASNSERDAEVSRQERREAMAAKRALQADDDDMPLSKRVHGKERARKEETAKEKSKKHDEKEKDSNGATGTTQKRRKPASSISQDKTAKDKDTNGSRSGTPAPTKRSTKPTSNAAGSGNGAGGGATGFTTTTNRRRPTAASSATHSPNMASSPLLSNFPTSALGRGDHAPSPSGLAIAISAAAPAESVPTPTTKSHKKGAAAAAAAAASGEEKSTTAARRNSKAEEPIVPSKMPENSLKASASKAASTVPNTPQFDSGPASSNKPSSLPAISRPVSPPTREPPIPASPSKRKRPSSPAHASLSNKRSKTPPRASSPHAKRPPQSPIVPPAPTPTRPTHAPTTSSTAASAPRSRPSPTSTRRRTRSPQQSRSPTPSTDPDPNEETYCFCNQVSYGQMVACDSGFCKYEWFHLPCVGLQQPPKGKAKWYCEDCRNSGRLRGISEGREGKRKEGGRRK